MKENSNGMNTPLFPHRWKRASGIIFYSTFMVGIGYLVLGDSLSLSFLEVNIPAFLPSDHFPMISGNGNQITNNLLDEILTLLLIGSGIVHGFSAEKVEDELIMSLRLNALTWSLIVNYCLLALANCLVFGLAYFNVMIAGMFGILVIFNVRFSYLLHKHYSA